ncbi:hypothetical protein EXIGLDRAFT_183681 [Exidia glandulosa HHB12029]|uniref:Uncharacterized protein n=1 Tax=Exidia glandulosa HHB12029 TaxID=1314781 RepID=A0A165F189_EXIGL|nr:hypothetical protein EXIGLDRAFT_183681 [Exidia glandulosa HHB12029]
MGSKRTGTGLQRGSQVLRGGVWSIRGITASASGRLSAIGSRTRCTVLRERERLGVQASRVVAYSRGVGRTGVYVRMHMRFHLESTRDCQGRGTLLIARSRRGCDRRFLGSRKRQEAGVVVCVLAMFTSIDIGREVRSWRKVPALWISGVWAHALRVRAVEWEELVREVGVAVDVQTRERDQVTVDALCVRLNQVPQAVAGAQLKRVSIVLLCGFEDLMLGRQVERCVVHVLSASVSGRVDEIGLSNRVLRGSIRSCTQLSRGIMQ